MVALRQSIALRRRNRSTGLLALLLLIPVCLRQESLRFRRALGRACRAHGHCTSGAVADHGVEHRLTSAALELLDRTPREVQPRRVVHQRLVVGRFGRHGLRQRVERCGVVRDRLGLLGGVRQRARLRRAAQVVKDDRAWQVGEHRLHLGMQLAQLVVQDAGVHHGHAAPFR